ncbi:MAG: response regulator transcription factor [Chloroflexota bacterium]|nr:response regulator transcription factor [Chloroflexota bacterium]
MRVLIVDDHALVRSGIASLLRASDIEVVGEASGGLEAVEKAVCLRPDIILMDIKMPGCNGLQATQLIKAEMPQAKIVMVTAFDDDEDLFEAMKNGAVGYILKNVKAEEFIELLSNVMKGEVAVSPWIASKIAKELFRNAGRLGAKHVDSDLTTKEEEVLRLVAGGARNKDIASSLFISENTVKYHLRNIMEKLQFKSRAQVAVYAAKRGIEPVRPEEKR